MNNKRFIIEIENKKGTEVREAMKRTEVESRRMRTFMAALALLVGLLSLLTAADSYGAATICMYDDTLSPAAPMKTGVDTRVLRIATTSANQDPATTKMIINLGGVAPGDVKYVRVYQAGTTLRGEVTDPTVMSNLSILLSAQKTGNDSACDWDGDASQFDIYVKLNNNETITSFTFELVSVVGFTGANLPHTNGPITVQLGCKARSLSDVMLSYKQAFPSQKIDVTWTLDSHNDAYKVYRSTDGNTWTLLGSTTTAPFSDTNSISPLTKYGYIVNGYDNANACDSETGNTLITQSLSDNKFLITTCGGCHTAPPDDAITRGIPDGGTVGRHANPYHTGGIAADENACKMCHGSNTLPAHRNGVLEMNTTAIFGQAGSYYDKNRNGALDGGDNNFVQDNYPSNRTVLDDLGSCRATLCHGTRAASPVWGSSSGKKQCNLCHGMGQGSSAWDTEFQNTPDDEQVGAHGPHLHAPGSYFANISTINACNECHTVPATHNAPGHYDTGDPAEIIFGATATNGFVITPVYSNTVWTCSNTYCHDGRNFKNRWADASNVTMPVWNNSNYLNNSVSDVNNCMNKCHGYPPKAPHDQQDVNCRGCHTHVDSTNAGFNSPSYYKHIDGVVTGLSCTGCHGIPPLTNNTALINSLINATGTFGASNRVSQFAQAQGKHAKHNGIVLNISPAQGAFNKDVCMVCHRGGGSLGEHLQGQSPDYITIGFNAAGNYKGWYQAPDYSGNQRYDVASGDGGTTVNYPIAGARACSSLYCHSDGGNYIGDLTYRFANWDGAALTCTSCHGSGSLYSTNNAHPKHINGATYNFKCQMCHAGTVAVNNTIIGNHINGAKNVIWNADTRVSGKAAYNKGGTNCSSVYCHSDGRSASYANTQWNTAGSCMLCHGGPNGSTGGAGTSLSTSHTAHTSATYGYRCADCHNTAVNYANGITSYALHVNSAKNVGVAAVNGPSATYVSTTCSATYCHGTKSPAWNGPSRASTYDACTMCHGRPTIAGDGSAAVNKRAPGAEGVGNDLAGQTGATDANVGAHRAHMENGAGGGTTGYSAAIQCSACHVVPASVTAAGHINNAGLADMTFSGLATNSGTTVPSYNAGTGSCSGVYCHGYKFKNQWPGGNEKNPVWINTNYAIGTTADCAKCHGYPPTDSVQHGGGTQTDCTQCHTHVNATNNGFSNRFLHVDGLVQGAGCGGCHGQPPISTATLVNSIAPWKWTLRTSQFAARPYGDHQAHSAKYPACATCHTGGQPTSGQHNNASSPTAVQIGFNINGTLGGWYQAPAFTNTNYVLAQGSTATVIVAAGGRACSSIYCHSDGGNFAGTKTYASPVSWDNTSLACSACHGSGGAYATTDRHPRHTTTYTYKCRECHAATVDFANAIIGNHVNFAKDVVFVNLGGGGSYARPNCSTQYCHSDGRGTNVTYVQWSDTVQSCTKCHGGNNGSTGGANTTLSTSHIAHTNSVYTYKCADCHSNEVDFANNITNYSLHVNNVKNVSVAAANGASATYVSSTCSATNCHGTKSPAWNGPARANTYDACTMCHGRPTVGNNGSALAIKRAPGAEGVGNDLGGTSAASDANVGAHRAHLENGAGGGTTGYSAAIQCNVCHVVPATVKAAGHIDNTQPAELTFTGNATNFGNTVPSYNAGTGTCSGVYCHGYKFKNQWPGGNEKNPTWANTNYAIGTTADCAKCHGYPPTDSVQHNGGLETNCTQCHSHVNGGNNGFSDRTKHVDGQVQATGCGGCHAVPPISNLTIANNSSPFKISNRFMQAGMSNAAGAHLKHNTAGYICATCHTGGQPTSGGQHNNSVSPTIVSIGFNTSGVMKGFYQAPAYSSNLSYKVNSSAAGTTVLPTAAGTPRMCSNINCHSDGKTAKTYAWVNWNGSATTCVSCHGGNNGSTGAAGTTLSTSHTAHTNSVYLYKCADCHVSTVNYANTVINTAWHGNGVMNVVPSAANGPSSTYVSYTCSTTNCHGTKSPAWNGPARSNTYDACTLCHGRPTVGNNGSAIANMRAPGYLGLGNDTAGQSGTADANVGAHDAHIRALAKISNISGISCAECHKVPANVKDARHIDNALPAELTFSGNAIWCGATSAIYNYGTGTCSATYCHNPEPYVSTTNHTNGGTGLTPTWNNDAYLTGVADTDAECNLCHYYNGTDDCSSCHAHVDAASDNSFNGSVGNRALHMDGKVQSSGGDCTGCHDAGGSGTTGPNTRRAIKPEFGMAWGHINTTDGPVTKFDCGVCHEEGDPTTGNTVSGKHNNGYIELRDPDTGSSAGANGVIFSSTEKFRRTLSNRAIETRVTQVQNFCIGCHDANGQNSGASFRVASGTNLKPWNRSGSVVNVKSQLNTANTSFHPVIGNQNNSYCDADTMNAPWNVITKSGNTLGDKISCFDCHSNYEFTGNIVLYNSIAHGGPVTLRQPFASVNPVPLAEPTPLCIVCHKSSIYWGATDVHGREADGNTHSAFRGMGSTRHDDVGGTRGCTMCHGKTPWAGTWPVRTERAIIVHGFNTTNEYSFLRGRQTAGDTVGWKWGYPTTPNQCTDMNCGEGSTYGPYTYVAGPGGSY